MNDEENFSLMLSTTPTISCNSCNSDITVGRFICEKCWDGWVSVKDRLPENTCEVFLVYRKNPKDIFFAEYLLPGNFPYTDHPVFLILPYPGSNHSIEEIEIDEITHWIPLPEIPK